MEYVAKPAGSNRKAGVRVDYRNQSVTIADMVNLGVDPAVLGVTRVDLWYTEGAGKSSWYVPRYSTLRIVAAPEHGLMKIELPGLGWRYVTQVDVNDPTVSFEYDPSVIEESEGDTPDEAWRRRRIAVARREMEKRIARMKNPPKFDRIRYAAKQKRKRNRRDAEAIHAFMDWCYRSRRQGGLPPAVYGELLASLTY